ncbi:MAG TPA: VOC family protein [Candidatus Nanopelagicaceae bacterium]
MKNPIHHLTLTVNDVEKSAAWYKALLGEATEIRREGPGWRRLRMDWPNGLIIGVVQFEDAPRAQKFSHLNVGLDHIGLACESEDEIHGWIKKLDELGFEHGPFENAVYGWVVTARDPDNIPIEFFCAK